MWRDPFVDIFARISQSRQLREIDTMDGERTETGTSIDDSETHAFRFQGTGDRRPETGDGDDDLECVQS